LTFEETEAEKRGGARAMRVHLIQDSRGTIIATTPSGVDEVRTTLPGVPVTTKDAEEHALQVEVVPEPLKGQTIHEVELPAELEAIEEGTDLLKALWDYRIVAGETKLVRR
jgi:hypothetical protein